MSYNLQLRPDAQPTRTLAEPSWPSSKRCAPNLPGSLTRSLSRRLGVDATTAMRIALLYGDMEWLAGGASQVRYSARDYARRQGLSRNTVLADLHRLQHLGALTLLVESSVALTLYGLHGLHPDSQDDSTANGNDPDALPSAEELGLAHIMSHPGSVSEQPPGSPHEPPGSTHEPPPGSDREPPPAQPLSHPWLTTSATLEKGFKTQEKKEEEERSNPKQPSPPLPEQVSRNPEGLASDAAELPPGTASLSAADQPSTETPVSPSRPSSLQHPASELEPSTPEPAEPQGASAQHSEQPAALLDRLLAAFRTAKPAEWPSPTALTLSPGRKGKLQAALRYAGSADALLQRLQTALAHVPPWYRTTYPVRPDGSRRPSHQFFDLLFRATGDEREGGLEAWHLFAWSEAASSQPTASWGMAGTGGTAQGHLAQESDLERAKRLFRWNCHDWLMREVEAIRLPLPERRRLTALLEADGRGTPGAGASQFADPPEPAPTDQPQTPMQGTYRDPYDLLEPFLPQNGFQGHGEASAAAAAD